MTNQILTAILPDLIALAGLVLTGLASWAALYLKRRFGIDVEIRKVESEGQLRDLLTQALTTGAKAVLVDDKGNTKTEDEKANAIVDYVTKSIPDTVTRLKAPRDILKQRALAILFDLALARLTKH